MTGVVQRLRWLGLILLSFIWLTIGHAAALEKYDFDAQVLAAKTTARATGDLSGSIAGSFCNGQYSSWVAETDTVLYRATNFAQDANGPGRFFGLSRPANSMDAEMMYNLKAWGNNATELLEYRIPAGTRPCLKTLNEHI